MPYDCDTCWDIGGYRDYRNGRNGRWTNCNHQED